MPRHLLEGSLSTAAVLSSRRNLLQWCSALDAWILPPGPSRGLWSLLHFLLHAPRSLRPLLVPSAPTMHRFLIPPGLSRPKIGDIPSFLQRLPPSIVPAQHGPLGSQHCKFWMGEGDSSDEEEEEYRTEKEEDDSWENPALRIR